MTDVNTALKQAIQQLNKPISDARLDAELLLVHILDKNRAYLYAHSDAQLDATQLKDYQQLIDKRAAGTPIAYLTGRREFWSMPLKVNEHTLIPRHETERLVELTLELLPDLPDLHILDLGTGSGAVALALAKERPKWHIVACDQSEDALDIAKENAVRLGITNVVFYHSNWFNALSPKLFTAIVSNPPYIAECDPHLTCGDVLFEPASALISGQDGLADLQYIIEQSYKWLEPDGILLLEHGFCQKNFVGAILNKSGYRNVQCWQDIQGQDRVSGARRPDNKLNYIIC